MAVKPVQALPTKKLMPITSLPVPEWPGKPMKPLSEHWKKLQLPSLKVEQEVRRPPAIEKMQERVSAPRRLELGPARRKSGVRRGRGKCCAARVVYLIGYTTILYIVAGKDAV